MTVRSRWLAVGVVGAALACVDPSDVLFSPAIVSPVEVSPGLFRVTFDPEPDVVRGFTPSGDTIIFRGARGTFPIGDTVWRLLGLDAGGNHGSVEFAGLYRIAITRPLESIWLRTNDRLLTWVQRGNDGSAFWGPGNCPVLRQLAGWRLHVLHLAPGDGQSLRDIPTWDVRPPVSDTIQFDRLRTRFAMRFTPGENEAELGLNPYGPVAAPGTDSAFFSDGQTLWRINLASPPQRDSVGQAIYPAVSADGALFAAVLARGLDSAFSKDSVCRLDGSCCVQEMWNMTEQGWTTVITRRATGDTIAQIDGSEPVFDPTRPRVLVRRRDVLVWVSLADGSETGVPNSTGAFGAAVSPDGKYLAFSKTVSNNTDVYFVKLN